MDFTLRLIVAGFLLIRVDPISILLTNLYYFMGHFDDLYFLASTTSILETASEKFDFKEIVHTIFEI